MRPEERLILRCCTGSTPDSALHAALAHPLDWPALTHIATQHRVLPIVYWRLRGLGQTEVPPAALAALRAQFAANARRNLALIGGLRKLLAAFAAQEIPVVPFKGIVLALLAYEHNALRMTRDLDLLVKRADVPRAQAVLTRIGCRIPDNFAGSDESSVFMRQTHALAYQHPEIAGHIELHWQIVPGIPLPETPFWAGVGPLQIGGLDILQSTPLDQLVMLLAHGSKHLWSDLIWAADVDAFVRRMHAPSWEALPALADTWRVGRFVRMGILACHGLLETPFPPALLAWSNQDRAARRLSRHAVVSLFAARTPGAHVEMYSHWAGLRLREGPRLRLAYLRGNLVNWRPSPRDEAFLRLPPVLRRLNPAVRLVRAAVRYSRALLRPGRLRE